MGHKQVVRRYSIKFTTRFKSRFFLAMPWRPVFHLVTSYRLLISGCTAAIRYLESYLETYWTVVCFQLCVKSLEVFAAHKDKIWRLGMSLVEKNLPNLWNEMTYGDIRCGRFVETWTRRLETPYFLLHLSIHSSVKHMFAQQSSAKVTVSRLNDLVWHSPGKYSQYTILFETGNSTVSQYFFCSWTVM